MNFEELVSEAKGIVDEIEAAGGARSLTFQDGMRYCAALNVLTAYDILVSATGTMNALRGH